MIANIPTVAFQGINTIDVDVQVHIAKGIPAFNIVGLADKAVAESRERIRAALTSINLSLPAKRITVNLSPADLFKEGSHYDLPIVLGLLMVMGVIKLDNSFPFIVLGELSLSGYVISVSGILPATIAAKKKNKGIICPVHNGNEASLIDDVKILAIDNLISIISYFNDGQIIEPPQKNITIKKSEFLDIKDIKGQIIAKRALEIAASGGHNVLMIGPPGTGKSMLAKCLVGLLPDMNPEEIMEINIIFSISKGFNGSIIVDRPFREPHSSCTMAAMIGGGRNIKPGEITMAHNGVLFLDEMPEFSRSVLDSLRQPLEDKNVSLSRANSHITFPANFQLIAAMNPCKCGYMSDVNRACSKAPKCGLDYQRKISGPLLDRIDISIEVGNVNILSIPRTELLQEDTKTIKNRVISAREIQKKRYRNMPFSCNALARSEVLEEFFIPTAEGVDFLRGILDKNYLSTRGYYRILKVARTIADMERSIDIQKKHIIESLNYRIKHI